MAGFSVHPGYVAGYGEHLDAVSEGVDEVAAHVRSYGGSNSHYMGILGELADTVDTVSEAFSTSIAGSGNLLHGTARELQQSAWLYVGSDKLHYKPQTAHGPYIASDEPIIEDFPNAVQFPRPYPQNLTAPTYHEVSLEGYTDLGGILGLLDDALELMGREPLFSGLLEKISGNPGALNYTADAYSSVSYATRYAREQSNVYRDTLSENWSGDAASRFRTFNGKLTDHLGLVEDLARAWSGSLRTVADLLAFVAIELRNITEKIQESLTKHKVLSAVPYLGAGVKVYDIVTGCKDLLTQASDLYGYIKGVLGQTKQLGNVYAEYLQTLADEQRAAKNKEGADALETLTEDMRSRLDKLGKGASAAEAAEVVQRAGADFVPVMAEVPEIASELDDDLPDPYQLGTPEGRGEVEEGTTRVERPTEATEIPDPEPGGPRPTL